MKTEMQVLEKLRTLMARDLDSLRDSMEGVQFDAITPDNIAIDFPDPDNMRKNTMFFIQPDYESLEALSFSSDLASMNATVFILCKGEANATLIKKVFAYFNAMFSLLGSNKTLDGFVDAARLVSMDYYPAVTASKNIVAIETALEIQWAKEY